MISVALCTYNGEKYLSQQLDSILSQTMPVDEIVVVDDCSTDDTVKIIEGIKNHYPDVVKLIVNEKNIGFLNNFEKAITLCKGDFIFLSDQDDLWRSDKVQIVVNYMKKEKCYGVFTDGKLIDADNKELGTTLFERLNFLQYIHNKNLFPDLYTTLCLSSNFVTGATMTITKEAKCHIIPFMTSSTIYHDSYIAIKLSVIDKLRYINDALIYYRIHSNQQIGLNNESNIKERIFDFLPQFDQPESLLNFIFTHRRIADIVYKRCKLTKSEFSTFKNSYTRYIVFLVKGGSVFLHIKSFIYYAYVELKSCLFRAL